MTSRSVHLVSLIPIALLSVVLDYHPAYWLALAVGVLLPEGDTISPALHRSWVFHTFLPVAAAYQAIQLLQLGSRYPWLVVTLHFVTLGLGFHFLFDFIYPKTQSHEGSEWPVRPTFFSVPWGLMWLGLAWLAQWFGYLAVSFLPWIVTDFFTI